MDDIRENEPDPFFLEVYKNALDTIADQMALILMRTAHSGIIRDSMDYSTAVCDAEGRTLAQGLTTAMHLGSFYDAMQALRAKFGNDTAPGDVFIFNDPYESAGQHLPDIYIIKPIFFEESLVGYATTVAHHADVGGIVPGSNALGAIEIFQEGLRLPILKFMSKGEPDTSIWDIIALNVRVPESVMGDLQAQLAACTVGEREYIELYKRYGAVRIDRYVEHLHDYAEQLARAEFSDLADGTYCFTDHIDGLGTNPEPIVLKVQVEVKGDRVAVDWAGSSPQIKGGVNSPFPFTKACAYTALRSIMPADVPNCHGYTRAIEVRAPDASVVKPVMPGPCGARGITGYRMIDCLFGALAQLVPERVTADGSGGSTLPTIGGYIGGRAFVFCETFLGTWGAAVDHDGQAGVPHMGANQANVPIEVIEQTYPLRIERYGMVPDSGGPGRHRGGLGLTRAYRLLTDEAVLSVRTDKRDYPPHGLFGGRPGGPALNVVESDGESTELPMLMTEPYTMTGGQVFRHVMSGGGGYGDPLEREPSQVREDVIDGLVSAAQAEAAYGVSLGPSPDFKVDGAATERLRQAAREATRS